jgi:hypothetical protein
MRHQFTISVWVGIFGDLPKGPYELTPQLAHVRHVRGLLCTLFNGRITSTTGDVEMATTQTMLFMYVGIPSQFNYDMNQILDCHYPSRWIGRNGPVSWPPRSPDLTPVMSSEGHSLLEKSQHAGRI